MSVLVSPSPISMESGDKASNQNCSPLSGWFQFASGFFKTGPSFSSPISHNLTINIFFFPLTNHYLSFQTIKLWQREFLPKLLVENGLRFPPVLQRKDLEHILQVMVAWWRWQWSKNHFSIKGHGAGKSSLTSKFKNVGLSADLATYNLCDF